MTGPKPAMSILDTTQLTLMRAISGATLRNAVLSNNIANADTPGFQPSDVDFHAALTDALGEGPEAAAAVTFSPEQLNMGAQRADGNGVDSEAEAAKLAENGLEMEALEQVASSRLQIMRTAMGGNP
ncbi:MAG TPA: flagellar basal body protein [Solirubrobacterales bacterium]|jgi:flagellar basal-body rod protein FlgB